MKRLVLNGVGTKEDVKDYFDVLSEYFGEREIKKLVDGNLMTGTVYQSIQRMAQSRGYQLQWITETFNGKLLVNQRPAEGKLQAALGFIIADADEEITKEYQEECKKKIQSVSDVDRARAVLNQFR